jgi:hypothetical protein
MSTLGFLTQDLINQTSNSRLFDYSVPEFNPNSGSAGGAPFNPNQQTSEMPRPTNSEVVSQQVGGIGGNTISYPNGLGQAGNQHWVKFEVFAVESSRLTGTGFAQEQSLPRSSQGRSDQSIIEVTKMKKLDKIIALPIPDSVATDYATMWSRYEGGLISDTTAVLDDLMSGDAKTEFLKSMAMRTASVTSSLADSVLSGMGADTALKKSTKRASNPRNEFLFDGVNNRSFNLQWKFIPKSESEANTIRQIIELFKVFMHPELDVAINNGSYYLFPAMFDITFMSGNSENEWLYRTSTCALTNMIVNYTGAGQWVAMDANSAPFAFDLTLQFTETEFLHRQRLLTAGNPDGVAR